LLANNAYPAIERHANFYADARLSAVRLTSCSTRRCWKVSACEVVHRHETAGCATFKHMGRCALGAWAYGQGPCGAASL